MHQGTRSVQLTCRKHDNFEELVESWRRLAEAGACSSLFSTYAWMSNWWRVWAQDRQLHLYSFCDGAGEVVGIAPLYSRRYRRKTWLPQRQLQWVGNVYGTDETVLSEYGDVIALPQYGFAVVTALARQLRDETWDECVIPLMSRESRLFDAPVGDATRWSVRRADMQAEGRGVRVATSDDFNAYAAALGKHTRLKLLGRRKLLQGLGQLDLVYADRGDIGTFLDTLNSLDRLRWGKPCFGPQSLNFHRSLAADFLAAGGLRLSMLRMNGTPVSVLYNLCFGGTEYNIQSAFDPEFHPKISLGTLHLGYALERAFADPAIDRFDLLFGGGKNEFYKTHYRGMEVDFYTLKLSRSLLAALLNGAAALKRRIAH